MQYHSSLRSIVLPEYGRHIQQMVDALLQIDDRELRNQQAKIVIQVMGNLFPHLRDFQDFRHKLWVHLMEISNWKLDVDIPYEIQPKKQEGLKSMEYINASAPHKKEFGRLIYQMIRDLAEQSDSEEKTRATGMVANLLKRLHHDQSKEDVSDSEVKMEIEKVSAGKLTVTTTLHTQQQIAEHKKNNHKKSNNYKKNQKQNPSLKQKPR